MSRSCVESSPSKSGRLIGFSHSNYINQQEVIWLENRVVLSVGGKKCGKRRGPAGVISLPPQ